MQLLPAIVAGLVGTAAMTALMMMGPSMGMPKMDVMGMLGSMVSQDESKAKQMGAVMHFVMGAIFAIVYTWLWGQGYTLAGGAWLTGLVYGLVHGVVAALAMPMMPGMQAAGADSGSSMMRIVGMAVGHAVFGVVVALVYTAMAA